MGVLKFNQHVDGKYTERYVNNPKFSQLYDLTQEHLVAAYRGLPVLKTVGDITPQILDIGAGPGIGAMLFDRAGLRARVTGFEPSDTHQDGVHLAEQLKNAGSLVEYVPIKGGLESAAEFCKKSDGVVMIRAAHEIVESVNGKNHFYDLIARVLDNIKRDGFFVITEPQYNAEITANPKTNYELIEICKKFQMETIGHCHDPRDYITAETLIDEMQKQNFTLVKRDLKQNNSIIGYLLNNGIKIEKSPFEIYALTFIKR